MSAVPRFDGSSSHPLSDSPYMLTPEGSKNNGLNSSPGASPCIPIWHAASGHSFPAYVGHHQAYPAYAVPSPYNSPFYPPNPSGIAVAYESSSHAPHARDYFHPVKSEPLPLRPEYSRQSSSSAHHMPSPSPSLRASPTEHHPSPNPSSSSLGNGSEGSPGLFKRSQSDELRRSWDGIVQHPLFPLVKFMLEKLEEATVTAVVPPHELLMAEIESCIRRIHQTSGSVTCGNPEIDDIMIQACGVLRGHLHELDKVNELCREFCDRYIRSLRTTLHADQILRADDLQMDYSAGDRPSPSPSYRSSTSSRTNRNSITSPEPNHSNSNQGSPPDRTNFYAGSHMASGSSSAYPVDHFSHRPQNSVPEDVSRPAGDNLAQGNRLTSPSSSGSFYDDSDRMNDVAETESTKGGSSGGNNKRRSLGLPKGATNLMRSWLFQHIAHPYPTEEEKKLLAEQTRLSMLQVNNWFINARRRILPPMMESNANATMHRAKKPMQPRPVDPFWTDQRSAPGQGQSAEAENSHDREKRTFSQMENGE